MIYSVKEYNKIQNREFSNYCQKCRDNNIEPTKQERYFPTIKVNYGFVVEIQSNGLVWKKILTKNN